MQQDNGVDGQAGWEEWQGVTGCTLDPSHESGDTVEGERNTIEREGSEPCQSTGRCFTPTARRFRWRNWPVTPASGSPGARMGRELSPLPSSRKMLSGIRSRHWAMNCRIAV